ncbi:MAG: hypothetical protein MUD10_01425 [Candidatus Pacebacteria bacterium]|nr:hypothetical protein [Candidatus Paceibacterota bacterium]
MRFERRGNLENTVKEAVKEYLTHYKLIGMNGAKVIVYQVLEKGTEASVISDSIADFIKEAVLEHQGT